MQGKGRWDMTANRKVTGRAMSIPAGLALGAGISMVVTLLGCSILAWMLDGEKIPESGIGYGSLLILWLSSMLGSMGASVTVKHQLLPVSMLTGVCYFGILLAITALFFGGQYQGMGVTALMVLAGSGCAVLALINGQGRGKKKLPKSRYR